ncbi:MAG: DUF1501 domain-containing protein [Planctomyces sp.]|nr:DUF1501 domain-containing protein [Planctomyces sp.]
MPRNRLDGPLGCRSFVELARLSRRPVLALGASTVLGSLLGRTPLAAGSDASSAAGFGRARRCILLFMWGGPSHLDTFDLKPEAPDEVRGPFRPISTSAPGVQICEHFTRLAGLMDRVAIVRSLGHDDPAHLSSAHTVLTGHLPPVNKSDAEPPSQRDTPHIGSMIARLRGGSPLGLPGFVTMPWLAFHPAAPGGKAPGQHGGWLGRTFDPLLIEGDPNASGWTVPALSLLDSVSAARLDRRFELLRGFDDQRRALESGAALALGGQQQQALNLLTAPAVREAFDLTQEPDAVRDRYGRHVHGQCVLLARRMAERDVPFVSVNWHNDGQNFWDTHGSNFRRLQNDLIPPADAALSALLTDLEERGLLDDTLVVWVGEFGRAPRINGSDAGRDHHPYCYSGLLAGAGIRGGAAYGTSDRIGSRPASDPVSPHDLAATMLHALGVPAEQTLPDPFGRPMPLYSGRPVEALFS